MTKLTDKCSVAVSDSSKKYTCLSKNQLVTLLESYNKHYKTSYKSPRSKKELYILLKFLLDKTEETEWWSLKFVPKDLCNELKILTHKTIGPEKKWGWLETDHINTVMKQYELFIKKKRKGKNFVYYKTVPADYFEINPHDVYDIKRELSNGKSAGIIFNTDTTRKSGEHWVGVYLDKDHIHYFDSLGNKPNKYLINFMNNFNVDHFINKISYQKKDGVCGIYAIEFLVMKALGKPLIFNDDAELNGKRQNYFRNYHS